MNSKLSPFTKNNKILMLALDHRRSFRRLLNPENPDKTDSKDAIELKQKIISALHEQMSGVLIDPDYGLPAFENLDIKNKKNYLMPIEKTGYEDVGNDRLTNLEYTIPQLKEMGARGVKLLIYYHPNSETKMQQIETAGVVMEMAKEEDFPYFLEIVTYNTEQGENLTVQSVQDFVDAGVKPDVFKLEYPGSKENCEKISKIIDEIPWILLTRGAEFDTFAGYLQDAVEAGASGFLAGRSIWQEVPGMDDVKEQEDFLNTVVVDRFKQISEIALNI